MPINATGGMDDAVDTLENQLRDLTVRTSSGEPEGEPQAAASSTATGAHAHANEDTETPATKPATTGGSLSATVLGRQWIMGKEAFEAKMPHHQGIQALWETKWKFPCSKSLYPFHDGKFEDFKPLFEYLIKYNINDGTSRDYTEAFVSLAETIVKYADAASASSNRNESETAPELYLRACAVYRIARFPYITSRPTVNDEAKWSAWTAQKAAYLKASSTWQHPVEEVMVPYTRAKLPNETPSSSIPVYVRSPSSPPPSWSTPNQQRHQQKHTTVILLTGLDGYRTDNTERCDEFLRRGWACVVVEIPGTADCPADPADPDAPERLWDSLLEWMEADGRFDMGMLLVWGLSSGGYYAIRIAHTHADKLIGVVSQGAGCHHFFDREWLERADFHEYPFQLTPAMALKHGYRTVEEYKAGVQKKFSLLENGILSKPCTRLLLVNGVKDGLMPIEDSMMLFEHGSPKEGRFFADLLHMGYPPANESVYPWMESVVGQKMRTAE